jgi:hypothetical protein
MSDLPRVVAESDVGSVALLEVWRKNKIINIEVKLGELPGEVVTERDKEDSENKILDIKKLGIKITNSVNGVEVVEINNETSNLKVGDIVTEVNREPITEVNSFINLVNKLEKTGRSSLLLKIIRDQQDIWITIKFNIN